MNMSAFGVVHKRQMTQKERQRLSRKRRLSDQKWEKELDEVAQQLFASNLPEQRKRAIVSEYKKFARQHRANEVNTDALSDVWVRHTPNTDPKQLWRDYATGKPQALIVQPKGQPVLHRNWQNSKYVEAKSARHPREFPGYGKIPKMLEGPKRVLTGATPWPRNAAPTQDWSKIVKSLRLPGKKIVRFRTRLHDGDGMNVISARTKGKEVGRMYLHDKNQTYFGRPHPRGEVFSVGVVPEAQHQGIATGMWGHAKKRGLQPRHSPYQSDEGAAWARTVR